MHAPDQTADRPQLLHCSYDLGRIAPLYKMPPEPTRIFIAIRGPQAHWDSGEPAEERRKIIACRAGEGIVHCGKARSTDGKLAIKANRLCCGVLFRSFDRS